MRRATSTLLVLLVAASGCLRPDPTPRYTPAWEPFDPSGDGWHTTQQALLISDCQIHNVYSKSLPERNLSAESAVATAIRPPQLDLFSRDVLEYILENGAPEASLVLHMGDALDVACEGEFETFLAIMETTNKPWFVAPGNHDFYYMGVYDPEDTELWQMGCFESGKYLTKDQYIKMYVAALLHQKGPGFDGLAEALGLQEFRQEPVMQLYPRMPDTFEWQADEGAPGYLRRICWHIDVEMPWRSYILQSVDLSTPGSGYKLRALLMDSCQYNHRPGLIPNAWQSYPIALNCGFTGEMLPDQLRKMREWVGSWRKPGQGYSLLCHHPFDELAPRTKSALGWLWRERQLGFMVTGHTHAGYYAHHDLGGDNDQLELNLGSTTDWPMEWRTLRGFVNVEEKKIYAQSLRRTLVDVLSNQEGYFNLDWEIPRDAPDDYRKYKQGEAATMILFDFYLAHHVVPYWLPQPHVRANAAAINTEQQVKNTLLWTYHRLISYFQTDPGRGQPQWPPKCETDRQVLDRILAMASDQVPLETKATFLKALNAFERSRSSRDAQTGEPDDAERARYKLSQAAWASRFEAQSGRRLRVEDELIRIDWERSVISATETEAETATEPDTETKR